jgi:hypothetical protein
MKSLLIYVMALIFVGEARAAKYGHEIQFARDEGGLNVSATYLTGKEAWFALVLTVRGEDLATEMQGRLPPPFMRLVNLTLGNDITEKTSTMLLPVPLQAGQEQGMNFATQDQGEIAEIVDDFKNVAIVFSAEDGRDVGYLPFQQICQIDPRKAFTIETQKTLCK